MEITKYSTTSGTLQISRGRGDNQDIRTITKATVIVTDNEENADGHEKSKGEGKELTSWGHQGVEQTRVGVTLV